MAKKFKISVAIIGFFVSCALSGWIESLAPTIIYMFTVLILQLTSSEIKPQYSIKKNVSQERTIDELIQAQRAQLMLMKNYTIQIDQNLDDVEEKVSKL